MVLLYVSLKWVDVCQIIMGSIKLIYVNNYIARSYRFVIVVTRSITRRTIKANIKAM